MNHVNQCKTFPRQKLMPANTLPSRVSKATIREGDHVQISVEMECSQTIYQNQASYLVIATAILLRTTSIFQTRTVIVSFSAFVISRSHRAVHD